MMNTSRTYGSHDLAQGPVTIRALRSLTRQHAAMVTQIVAEVPGRWEIELHDDYEGYLSILVSPIEPGSGRPAHLVSGTIAQIEVSAMDGDTLRQLGCYETIDQAATRLRNVLADYGEGAGER